MAKLSVRDLDLKAHRVLMRVDFNVPMEKGSVESDARLRATLPTLRLLHERGARAVLCSHLGRPKGKPDPRYSLRPVAEALNRLLDEAGLGRAEFCPDVAGEAAQAAAATVKDGGFLLLENLRFEPGEEKNEPEFSARLARLAELYVNDAFGSAHRAHASTVGCTVHFKQRAAGLLMESELEHLGRLLTADAHPYVVILGGAKVSDKLPVLRSLAQRADSMLIGGAMAYTFLAAQGKPIGRSLFEPDLKSEAAKLLEPGQERRAQVQLPSDHVVASSPDDGTGARVVETIPAELAAFDIGPATRRAYAEAIGRARMVFWNGPMGIFEKPPFNAGTLAVAEAVANCKGMTVAGGGDSVAALQAAGLADRLTHVSTGGGASLEFLAGDTLPGVAALSDRP